MTAMKVECVQCGKKMPCVLLQLCVPVPGDEEMPHEKIEDFLICRPCLSAQGTLGMWMDDILRRHSSRER